MEEEPDADRPVVLVVDDTPDNLKLMNNLLRDSYRVKVANSGERALALAFSEAPPDLIMLDIMMPGMDGYEVCRRLQADTRTRDIPIIFLTARSAREDEENGLALGAVDYVTKPVNPPIVLARVRTHLQLKATADFLRDKAAFLEREVRARTRELAAIQDVTIMTLASLAETRDTDTGNHIRRTQHYVKALAEALRDHPRFEAALTESYRMTLFKSAPLHDIGKVGIPDRILLKPGKFEPGEWEIMKTHGVLGRQAIEQAERSLGIDVDFLTCAKEIAQSHHEKWDGTGYPDGKAGENIPIAARLMALADVYDALISRRIYKDGMPHQAAAEIILKGKGSHFDPDVVGAFAAIQDEFRAIAQRHADTDEDVQKKRDVLEASAGADGAH